MNDITHEPDLGGAPATPLIDDALLDAVAAKIAADGVDEDTVFALRKAWPGIHFTYCMDDDLGALEPYREEEGFNLYLVTGRDHCVSFTREKAIATGLVVAYVDDDAL
ncbi:MAG: DUF6129 family protein [Pseudomonadota bacterium]